MSEVEMCRIVAVEDRRAKSDVLWLEACGIANRWMRAVGEGGNSAREGRVSDRECDSCLSRQAVLSVD